MRSAAYLALSVLFLLLVAPPAPAVAGDWVEGDGYRFRLPPEFVDVQRSQLEGKEELDKALKVLGGAMPRGVDLDMKAFVRQRGEEPDAALFVMALHADEAAQGGSEPSIDALEREMRKTQKELESRGAMKEITRIRRILVSAGQPALEVEIAVDEPEAGPLNAVRLLFVIEKRSLCMLGFLGTRKRTTEDAMTWRAIVTSFRLDERGSIVALLMRYGPFVLGGLVLLIALVLLKRSSSRRLIRPVLSTRPGGGGDGGAGFSRALDGLPVYGHGGGEEREPAAGEVPAPGQALPAASTAPSGGGPRIAPTIPRAAPPVGEGQEAYGAGGDFAPLPERAPASADGQAAPSGGPTGLPRKLPPAYAPPPPPPPAPESQVADALHPPAVAERIEVRDLPVGSDMPTNVAMRGAKPEVSVADSADEVLSRLMGLQEDAVEGGETAEPEVLAPAAPPEGKPEGAKIQRNSDFFT